MSVRLSMALAEALHAQLPARNAALDSGATPVGWKIAASIPGVGPDEGVDGSVFGYLTGDTVRPTGSRIRVGATVNLCGEVELAVEIGQDLLRTPTSTWPPQPSAA
jgi:2-keto-4-pentenoate hydratase